MKIINYRFFIDLPHMIEILVKNKGGTIDLFLLTYHVGLKCQIFAKIKVVLINTQVGIMRMQIFLKYLINKNHLQK